MTNDYGSDEVKCEPDPKDGIETNEALTDQQLASVAAGQLALTIPAKGLIKGEFARAVADGWVKDK